MSKVGRNMFDLRKNNRVQILRLIHENGMLSRKDLSVIMGLTPATLSINVNEMINDNILYEVREDDESRNVGRKKMFVDINYDFKKIIGINIDKGSVILYLGDMKLNIIEQIIINCDTKDSVTLLDELEININYIMKKYNLKRKDVIGIGISIVGIVDRHEGVSVRSWHILEKNFKLKERLEELVEIPCYLENNVRSLAQAHKYLNYPEQSENFIFVKYGNGIGTAISVNDQFYEGNHLKSGELGHVYVANNDLACRCNKIGCLETVASTWRLKEILGQDISNEEILNRYNNNDTIVNEYIENAITHMAVALSNYITLYDPNEVVLYGYIFENQFINTKLLKAIEKILSVDVKEKIKVSNYNMNLEGSATLSIALKEFIEYGRSDK